MRNQAGRNLTWSIVGIFMLTVIFMSFFTGCERRQDPVIEEELRKELLELKREQSHLRAELEEIRDEMRNLRLQQDEITFMMTMADEPESPLMKTTIKISLVILLLLIILLLLYSLYQRKLRKETGQDVVVTTESEESEEAEDMESAEQDAEEEDLNHPQEPENKNE